MEFLTRTGRLVQGVLDGRQIGPVVGQGPRAVQGVLDRERAALAVVGQRRHLPAGVGDRRAIPGGVVAEGGDVVERIGDGLDLVEGGLVRVSAEVIPEFAGTKVPDEHTKKGRGHEECHRRHPTPTLPSVPQPIKRHE